MKAEIKVPSMGESVVEAIVVRILKEDGASVNVDEEIVELETEKVNQVLYAPASGKLSWKVKLNDKVKIGDVIGTIDSEAEGKKSDVKAEKPAPKAAPKSAPAPASPAPQEEKPREVKGGTRKRMSGLRRTIAERLVEVKNRTAMLTTFNEVDLSAVMEIRNREQDKFVQKFGVRLGYTTFFVKAVVAAMKAVPEVNSMIDGEEIVTFSTYDISIAVSTERGLVVPVIRGCDKLSYGQIQQEIDRLAEKARLNQITVDEMRGGSFTITNAGIFGSLLSTPILNPPQSAILGMHTILKRPVAIQESVQVRPMMYIALSYDHRVIDGKEAVVFLMTIKQSLEDASKLVVL